MSTDIKITFTNQAQLQSEDNCVVVFATPTQESNGPSVLAWQVIKNVDGNDLYSFEYSAQTLVQATWDGGRSGTARQVVTTSSFVLAETSSGFILMDGQSDATPSQFPVVNRVDLPGITFLAFKSGRPIMSQSHWLRSNA